MKKIFAFGLIGAVLYGVAADAAATRSTARTRAPAGQTTTTQSANAQSVSGNTMSGTARRAPRAAICHTAGNFEDRRGFPWRAVQRCRTRM